MMFLPTNEQWTAYGITHNLHKFFVQRWHELFDEDTYDSWQVQTSNVHTLLAELSDSVHVIVHTPVSHHNFGAVLDELKAIAKVDPIIKNHFPFVRSLLETLTYDTGIKDAKRHDLEQTLRRISVIEGHLIGYEDRLREEIVSLVRNPVGDKNHELCHLLMSLAASLLAKGYSVPALRESVAGLTDSAQGDFPLRIERLLADFSGKSRNFTCHFLVRWTKPLPPIESRIATMTDARAAFTDPVDQAFLDQDTSASILSIRVQAQDMHAARACAEHELCGLLSLNRLYQPHKGKGASWNSDHMALVLDEDHNTRQQIPSDASRLTYIRHASKPGQATADTLKLIENLKNPTQRDVLRSSLLYHRHFTEATADEARLVNLWIALEILIPSGTGSMIDRLSDYVSTILTTEYPVSVAKALPIAMRAHWKPSDKATLLPQLARSNASKFDVYDVLQCLTDKRDGDLIKALLSLVGDQPILVHKVNLLWKMTYREPTVMKERLASHKQKLDWQLRRIYRARNYVMHRGRSVQGMRQLIQHLHTYYIMLIHTIIHDLKYRPLWGIEEACESRKNLYANALVRLKDHKNSPIAIEDILRFFSPGYSATSHTHQVWAHLLQPEVPA